MNIIASHLDEKDILLNVDIASKERLFGEIGRHMALQHGMPEAYVTNALGRRESIGSTGLGEGVAIPHARIKDLDRVVIAYLRLKTPIPFDSPDHMPVKDVLVLLVPQQATELHLQILADVSQCLADRKFRGQLHGCDQATAVKQLFSSRMSGL